LHSGSSEEDFGVAGVLSFLSGGFEGCTLQFRGLKLDGLYENADSICRRLATHYRNEGLNNLSTVIGSLNIFGNPAKFFKDIGSSIEDLTDSTAELEPANMIVDTAGLIQTGVAGGFGAMGNFTHSVGGAVGLLSMDQEWMAERSKRRMKQKPSNMFEGVIQGGGGLLGGIWDGVKGVVEKPIQGAENGGIGGFFSGAGKGILGLFTKPVTGVVD